MASYGERPILNPDGTPKIITLAMAQSMHPPGSINPPKGGNWTGYFGSLTVQGYLGYGWYIQLGHLSAVVDAIPFHPGIPQTIDVLSHSPALRRSISAMKHGKVMYLEAGELIGWSGMTGCGWGGRHLDLARIGWDGRPDFRDVDYPFYDEPHVHLDLFWMRRPIDRTALIHLDPFGVYSANIDDYPQRLSDWHRWPGSLWLPQV